MKQNELHWPTYIFTTVQMSWTRRKFPQIVKVSRELSNLKGMKVRLTSEITSAVLDDGKSRQPNIQMCMKNEQF